MNSHQRTFAARINRAVNGAITYQSEVRKDGAWMDVWQAPADTVANGTGDCEDYAILKMQLLRGLVPNLHLLWCQLDGQNHITLAVGMGADAVLLDNRTDHLYTLEQTHYDPVLWVDTDGVIYTAEGKRTPGRIAKFDAILKELGHIE